MIFMETAAPSHSQRLQIWDLEGFDLLQSLNIAQQVTEEASVTPKLKVLNAMEPENVK